MKLMKTCLHGQLVFSGHMRNCEDVSNSKYASTTNSPSGPTWNPFEMLTSTSSLTNHLVNPGHPETKGNTEAQANSGPQSSQNMGPPPIDRFAFGCEPNPKARLRASRWSHMDVAQSGARQALVYISIYHGSILDPHFWVPPILYEADPQVSSTCSLASRPSRISAGNILASSTCISPYISKHTE